MSVNFLELLMMAPVPMGLVLTALIACKLRLQATAPKGKLL